MARKPTATKAAKDLSPAKADFSDPLKADFRNFLFVIWQHLGLGAPTPVQYDIAFELQHGTGRDIIEAFRGVGKSWITVAYVLWRLYCDPVNERILVVSAGAAKAEEFTTFCLQLIREVEELKHLIPRDDQRQSTERFDVNGASPDQSPSVKSVGIFGQITGSRATCIVGDDIETPKTAETAMMRIKLRERVKEFDAVIKPGGVIKYLGTPQVEDSLYAKLEEVGYRTRIWPAQYPDDKQRQFYGDRLGKAITTTGGAIGSSTEPTRFDDEDLAKRKRSWGRSGFALQFMLDTRLSDAAKQPLRISDLMVMDLPDPLKGPSFLAHSFDARYILSDLPNVSLSQDRWHKPAHIGDQWEDYTGSVMVVDPSGRGADETAYAVVKHLAGFFFLTAAGGIQGGYEAPVLNQLAEIAKAQKVNVILVEENFGQGMFANLLKPVLVKVGYPCTIELVRHSKQKELRIIDTLEPVISGHRLVVNRQVILQDFESVEAYDDQQTAHLYRLFYQMPRITRERNSLAHDDRLDALAMAVAYWEEKFKGDQMEAMREIQEARLDEALAEFMDSLAIIGPKAEPAKGFSKGRR